jgi:hypothetical protein
VRWRSAATFAVWRLFRSRPVPIRVQQLSGTVLQRLRSHCRYKRLGAHDVHDAREIVSQHVQCHLGGNDAIDAARVELLLSELRLPAIKLMWAALAARADKEGWPAARFLAALAEHEIADRGRRRIERHLASARLPSTASSTMPSSWR